MFNGELLPSTGCVLIMDVIRKVKRAAGLIDTLHHTFLGNEKLMVTSEN